MPSNSTDDIIPPTTTSITTTPTGPIAFNIAAQAPLKLSSTNYTAWSFQFRILLTGYDLFGHLDGSKPCPPKSTTSNNVTTPNPSHLHWIRQDHLILSAIIGSLTPTLIPFIAGAKTARDAWDTLTHTYGKASRGRILALRNRLHNPSKGNRSITDYMLEIKGIVDELSLLGVIADPEDLVLKILNGLDDTYKEIANAIQARETSVTFDELHEILLSMEAQMAARMPTPLPPPATAFYGAQQPSRPSHSRPPGRWQKTQQPAQTSRPPTRQHQPASTVPHSTNQRQYQGKCQLCGEFGHAAKRCPSYNFSPVSPQPATVTPAYSSPSAHTAYSSPSASEWILDSGASHHITSDLSNLSLHAPYNGDGSSYGGDSPTRATR